MVGAVVVGTGFGSVNHVTALRKAGIDVLALVGRDEARTAARAAKVGVATPLTSLADALALPGVDLAVVATPPATHAELVLEVIAAGKHVVCEKPFARSTDEARQMQEAADKAGVINVLGTEFRWGAAQAHVVRAIAEGVIGTPKLATFILSMPALSGVGAEVPDWLRDSEQSGGWLGAYAPHVVDQVRATLGEFEGVSAALPIVSDRGWSAEDGFSVRFRTTSGVEGYMQSTPMDYGDPLYVTRLVGSTGALWVDGITVRVADASGTRDLPTPEDLVLPPTVPPQMDEGATAYDWMVSSGSEVAPTTRMYEVIRNVIGGAPMPTDPRPATFADGVANVAVIDAIRASAAAGGQWVPAAPS